MDLFIGIGATAIAAKELGRIFLGDEIHEPYHTLTMQRLNKTTCLF